MKLSAYAAATLLGFGVLLGCSKPPAPSEGDAAVASPGTTSPAADAAKDSAAPAKTEPVKFNAKYTIVPGTMYVPSGKDWPSVKLKDDVSKMVGDGTLSFTVHADGRISGASEDGPLGKTILDGTMRDNTLTATIRRADLHDEGLTGTLVAERTGDKVEGTMKLSEWNAAIVREGTISGRAEQ
ncbi:MAG: hypothetical protein FWD69_03290 [Polyangiaceae bacterium]|nr:hypothetical protein [Polyangiaceae bacterium]